MTQKTKEEKAEKEHEDEDKIKSRGYRRVGQEKSTTRAEAQKRRREESIDIM